MDWLASLMRPDLRDIAPYQSARTENKYKTANIAIDANESPWPPFGAMGEKCDANRYPEPQPVLLRQRLSEIYGVMPEKLLLCRGSDEGIDLLIRMFCRAGQDNIIICPPTFGMYEVCAKVQGAKVVKIPLLENSGWQLDLPSILAACSNETKLIFIPSPNAPMGHLMLPDTLLELCRARTEQSLIVIDEAYIEFTKNPEGMLGELDKFPNLVLLRTMSKAYAMAGERIGCVIGNHKIINELRKIQAPYPLTRSSIMIALDAFNTNGIVQSRERRKLLIAERERMKALLQQSPMVEKVFPSEANFLLVQTKNSSAFMQRLQGFGIRARNRDSDIPGAVRLTISAPEENDAVLKALDINIPKEAEGKSNRLFSVQRKTNETQIEVTVNLDKADFIEIETGIGFFDHMLAQLAQHGGFSLALKCKGDLHVDQHHTIEDCALTLGEALNIATGDKKGLARFGFSAPLDEALAEVVIDISGRPFMEFNGKFPTQSVGSMNCEMVPHFFRSFATALRASVHINVKGENSHHMIEACFKAVGRALRQALKKENGGIPSTKGTL